jgi:exodeoxyribonuclease V beta subunit
MLSKYGIPAVTVSDPRVFETKEAKDLLYILQAIEDISVGNINRALLTGLIGLEWRTIHQLNQDKLLEQFYAYKQLWQSDGVYPMLRKLISDCEVVKKQQLRSMPNADRVIANTMQLMEMLHEAESRYSYDSDELIYWLKRGIEGEQIGDDAHLQRIESDENAVNIVTIHRCKGLEYDIVIAPYLDMLSTDKFSTAQFRNNDGYFIAHKKNISEGLKEEARAQIAQENLRLLYVAITRARYHCYALSANCLNEAKMGDTSLKKLQNNLLEQKAPVRGIQFCGPSNTSLSIKSCEYLFDEDAPELLPFTALPASITTDPTRSFPDAPILNIKDQYWRRTSYTGLNPGHQAKMADYTEPSTNEYDRFTFHTLRRGAHTGNLLHDVFEQIDFTNEADWDKIIQAAMQRYPSAGLDTTQLDNIKELVRTVVQTTMPGAGVQLAEVGRDERLSELEFDVPLTDIDWKDFPSYLEPGKIPLQIKQDEQLTGLLNGKIDLFFSCKGKYYILDWKSNHLGYDVADYDTEALGASMESNNYYLQYYLYCLAMVRYLKLRSPHFDYEQDFGGVYYLFVRGIRNGQGSGIYFHKPKWEDLVRLAGCLLKSIN